jgi:capsular polysaccharide transport system permease protein
VSHPIAVKLNNYKPEDIKSKVKISARNNRILCDLSAAHDLCSGISAYQLFSGEKLVAELSENLDFQAELLVPETATYHILITYKDFDRNEHVLDYEIFVERKELSSSDLGDFANIKQKQSLSLLFNIIYAFIIREFQRKYDKGYFRYFSIILGPGVQLAILVVMFSLIGRESVLGLSIPLFVLTGILPYGFFTSAGNCLSIISGNRALLNYKQVKIIDTIVASILMELMVMLVVFLLGLFVLWYFGFKITVYNPLSLFSSFILLFILTFGLAMILSVVGFYFSEFSYAIQVIFRALFYVSGVFFSIETIPVQYQKFFLWNPLLQLIEFIRFSFVGFNLPHELSYVYLFKCTIIILTLGVSLYFINRHKFLINDRARV